MPLVRIPGIIAATIGLHLACTPPSGVSKVEERVKPTILERTLLSPLFRTILKTAAWYAAFAECAVIIANQIPQLSSTQGILRAALFQHGDPQRLAASPTFLVGVAVAVSGTYLRNRCYKELGTLFTFERTIRSGHRLVTSGPYSVVRHPSYAALIPIYLGMGMCQYDHNSWLRQSSVMKTRVGRVVVGSVAAIFILKFVPLFMRVPKEDATLKKEFGEEWEQWARRVPYAMIPGIY